MEVKVQSSVTFTEDRELDRPIRDNLLRGEI